MLLYADSNYLLPAMWVADGRGYEQCRRIHYLIRRYTPNEFSIRVYFPLRLI